MKTLSSLCCLLLAILAPSRAVIVETHNFNSLDLDIPDGSPSGLANVQSFATAINFITDVDVSLRIIGTPDANPLAFNGDLYVYLVHESGFSVLLNRIGAIFGVPFGYDDNGVAIVLDDAAANGDVHLYRNVVTPALGAPLTGTWRPDGRATDPNVVLNTDPRTALLGSFNGLSAAGNWTLFVADASNGEDHRLANWSLTITGDPVPEPATAALLGIGGMLLLRRRRRSRSGASGG